MYSKSAAGRGAPRHTRPADSPSEPPAARRKVWRSTCSLPALRHTCEPASPLASPCITFFPQHPAPAENSVIHSRQTVALQPLQAGQFNKITVIVAKRDQAGSCATLEEVQPPAWFYMMFRNKTLSYFVQLHVSPQILLPGFCITKWSCQDAAASKLALQYITPP